MKSRFIKVVTCIMLVLFMFNQTAQSLVYAKSIDVTKSYTKEKSNNFTYKPLDYSKLLSTDIKKENKEEPQATLQTNNNPEPLQSINLEKVQAPLGDGVIPIVPNVGTEVTTGGALSILKAPQNLHVVSTTSSDITLEWEDINEVPVDFIVYRDDIEIAKTRRTDYIDEDINPQTSYTYRVKAFDGDGNTTEFSNSVVGMADSDVVTTPQAIEIDINDEIIGTIEKPDEAVIYKFTTNFGGTYVFEKYGKDNINVCLYENELLNNISLFPEYTEKEYVKLKPNTTYMLKIEAINQWNDEANYNISINAPSEGPSNLTVLKCPNEIKLSWKPPADEELIREYKIYRNKVEIGERYAEQEGEYEFSDYFYSFDCNYIYEVEGVCTNGARTSPSAISIDTKRDYSKPSTPKNLRITSVGFTTATITWDESNDSDTNIIYMIFQDGVLISGTDSNEYVCQSLVKQKLYTYTIKAVDFCGNESDASLPLSVKSGVPNSDDCGNTSDEAIAIKVNEEVGGKLEYYEDIDCYNFIAPYTGDYKIETKSGEKIECELNMDGYWHNVMYGQVHLIEDKEYSISIKRFIQAMPTLTATNGTTVAQEENTSLSNYGIEYSFKILAPKEPPVNLVGYLHDDNKVTLTWSEPPIGVNIVKYLIIRNGEIINTSVSTFYEDADLIGDNAYMYSIKAELEDGSLTAESNEIIIAIGIDKECPRLYGDIYQIIQTGSTVTLKWDGAADNFGIVGYEIYRNGNKIADTIELSYTDSELVIGNTYEYKVRAYDKAGNFSERYYEISVVGDHPNSIEKAYGIDLDILYNASIDYMNDVDVFSFNTNSEGTYGIVAIATDQDKLDSVYPGYCYQFDIYDTFGKLIVPKEYEYKNNRGLSYEFNAHTTYYCKIMGESRLNDYKFIVSSPLDAPTNIEIISTTTNSISLKWDTILEVARLDGYIIYRNGIEVATTQKNEYTDKNILPNTLFNYEVKSYTIPGALSKGSNEVSSKTLDDKQIPTPPTGLEVNYNEYSKCTVVRWNPSQDDGIVEGYEVYRNNEKIGTVKYTEYVDRVYLAGERNIYTVRAFDSVGNYSEMSEAIEFYDQYGDSKGLAVTIEVNKPVNTITNYWGDKDYFMFVAPESGEYEIEFPDNMLYDVKIYDEYDNLISYIKLEHVRENYYYRYKLSSNKLYYMEAKVNGYFYIGNYSFIIKTPIKPPTNLSVSNNTTSSVDLKWEAPVEGQNIVGYVVYRNGQEVKRVTTQYFKDSGLSPDTKYIYEVKAYNDVGTLSISSTSIVIITTIDNIPPTKPSQLRVEKMNNDKSVSILWSKSTDNGQLSGYEIYKNGIKLGNVAQEKYIDTTFKAGTNNIYTVKAFDSQNNFSEMSEPLTVFDDHGNTKDTATVIGVDTYINGKIDIQGDYDYYKITAPVTGIYYIQGYGHSTSINGYLYNENGDLLYTDANSGYDDSFFVNYKFEENKTYYILILHCSYSMIGSYSINIVAPPKAPINLAVKSKTATSVTLKWEIDSKTDANRIAWYSIYRNGIAIGSSFYSEYTDSKLNSNTTFNYEVTVSYKYSNFLGIESDHSMPLSVITEKDEQAPSKPTNLALKSRSSSTIQIAWDPSSDNGWVAGYDIFRDGVKIGSTVNNYYIDKGLSLDTIYSYTVKAFDQANNYSDLSNELKCSTGKPQIIGLRHYDGTAIGSTLGGAHKEYIYVDAINVNNVSGAGAKFEYSKDNINWISTYISGPYAVSNVNTQSYFDVSWDLSQIPEGTYAPYTVRVTVYDEAGNSDTKTYTYTIDRKAPEPAQNLKASSGTANVVLNWNPSVDADVHCYRIYKSNSATGTFTLLRELSGKATTSYTDTNVEVGKTYYYMISAVDGFNQEGKKSEATSVTVTTDKIPPVILGVEPVNEMILGQNAEIIVRAADENRLQSIKLQYSTDGANWIDITSTSVTSSSYEWRATWKTTPLNGEVKLRAIATDLSGNTSDGSPIRTYTIDNQGPAKVTNLTAKPGITNVLLNWSDVPDQDFSYFVVERKDTQAGEFKQIGTVNNALGMNVTPLAPSTTYWFRVAAVDIRGNKGAYSDEIQAITAEDKIAPVISSINPKPNRFSKEIPLQITAVDNVAISKVIVQTSKDKTNWTNLVELKQDGTKASVIAAYILKIETMAEGSIYVRAIAEDTKGNQSISTSNAPYVEYIIDHTAPASPQNLKVASTPGNITISWDKGTDSDILGFRVYRATNEAGPYAVVADNHQYISFTDTDLVQKTNYYYKVAAIDIAGNEGLASDPIVAMLQEDKEAPQIVSIAPAEGITLAAKPTIRVLVSDNYKLSKVTAEYKLSSAGAESWTLLGSKALNINNDVISFTWDTTNLSDGNYTIRMVAEDSSGNKSIEKIISYNLNLEASQITSLNATPGGWKVALNWTINETSDLFGYKIYRSITPGSGYKLIKETEETSFIDEKVPPMLHYYKVQAIDIYGNTSWSNEITATPIAEDTYPPLAEAGDDLSITTGMETMFDGSLSSDNDQIASYMWDFGDGNSTREISPRHIYNTAGTYTVTLTITDKSGNTSVDTTIVNVYPPQEVGTLNITVLEENTGAPLGGASVVVQYSDGKLQKYTTDGSGKVKVTALAGECKIFAYKTNHMPVSKQVTVTLNETTNETLFLEKGEILKGELTAKRMTLEELKEANIDLTAPENQWVYKFEVHLGFTVEPIVVNSAGTIISGGGPITLSKGGSNPQKYTATPVAIPHPNHPEVAPTFGYLIIPAETTWIKEFFDVTLTLFNSATEEFPITDTIATLKLPEGLALATTKDNQTLDINMGTINGQEKREVSWIIRGDKKGEYNLEAEVNGNLQPFNDPVRSIFKTKDPLKVWGEDAVVMHVVAEDYAINNVPYKVYFGLENVANFPIYKPHINIGPGENYEIISIEEAESTKDELKPGKIHWLECTLRPIIGGTASNTPFKLDLSKSFSIVLEGSTAKVETKLYEIDGVFTRSKRERHFGEPGIYIPTGTYTHASTDIKMDTPGFVLNISRTYNSRDEEESSVLGKGWSFGFEGSVKPYEFVYLLDDGTPVTFKYEDILKVKLPDGSSMTFVKEGASYKAMDSYATLDKTSIGGYILTTKDQYKYGFSQSGYLEYMEDRNGNRIIIGVDEKGKVTSLQDSTGRSFTLGYNSDEQLESIIGPNNIKATYSYENKKLTKVQDSMGHNTHYNYDEKGYLTEVVGNDLVTIEKVVYNYDAGPDKYKVDSITDKFGNVHSYGYNNMERKVTITDSMTETDSRQAVQWYNSDFQVIKSRDPEEKLTEIEYTKFGEQKKVVSTTKEGTIFKQVEYERDDRGNITKAINKNLSTTEAGFDEKNNMLWQRDEMGKMTYFIYDAQGINLLKKVQPLNGTDKYEVGANETAINEADFAITKYSYYPDNTYNIKGLLMETIDPEGNRTTYTYDQYGNVKTVSNPRSSESLTTFEYDELGQKTAEISAKGYRTEYEYNNNGQLERVVVNKGNTNETIRTVYDDMGRVIQEITPNQYDPQLDDIANHVYKDVTVGTRYIYYSNGLLKEATDSEGNKTTYTYDIYGNVKTETKPSGAIYSYEYDMMNRPRRKYYQGNPEALRELLEEYTYEILPDGNTKKTQIKYLNETDQAVTTQISDFADRLIEQQNPDETKVKTSYNLNGTLNSVTDENGAITYYEYDGLNRLIVQWTPLEKEGTKTLYNYKKQIYDKSDRVIKEMVSKDILEYGQTLDENNYLVKENKYYQDGKLKSVIVNGRVMTEYEYDNDGNLSKEIAYRDETSKNITEYMNNHMGKPETKTVYVAAGDIFANDFESKEETKITSAYTYDANGNLKTVTTQDGMVTTYDYDSLNRVTKVSQPGIDENDKAIKLEVTTSYNWEGKELEKTDANGNKTLNVYDDRGNLIKVIDSNGGVSLFEYDKSGRIITEVTPKNYKEDAPIKEMSRIKYNYDNMGRLISKLDLYQDLGTYEWKAVVQKAYKYDNKGKVVKELDALGLKAGNSSSIEGNIENGYGTEYSYNLAGLVTEVIDPVASEKGLAYSVKYQYDSQGRKASVTNAKGEATTYTYDELGNQTSTAVNGKVLGSSTYDLLGNVLTTTDGNGNATKYEYNNLGKVRKVEYPGDASIDALSIIYQYDVMGNLIKQQDSMGKVTFIEYDGQGRVILNTIQDIEGKNKIQTSAKYDKNGNKRYVTDGNGTVIEYTYDTLSRVKTQTIYVTSLNENKTKQTTTYEYDANGNQTKVIDWRGNVQTNIYNPLNRLIEKLDQYGKRVQRIEYNDNNLQVVAYDAYGKATKYSYDRNNRLLETIDPVGHKKSQAYDELGNVASKTDGRGNVTSYGYDEFNRLKDVTNKVGEKTEVTSYTYDLNGNLLTQTNGKGEVTTYEYNVFNKAVKKINNGGRTGEASAYIYDPAKTETYTYYADGNIKSKVDRNGVTTSYLYDGFGRLTSTKAGKIEISYTYDADGNQLTMTDSTGTTKRTYDELGRVLTKEVPSIGVVEYLYDMTENMEDGCIAEKTIDPKGNINLKVYDRVGRLKEVKTSDTAKSIIYTYYDNGNRRSVTYHNGVKEEYTYYDNGQLSNLRNLKADGTVIDEYSYGYDMAGNQVWKKDKKGTTSYTYDELNRLSTVTEPGNKVTSYTYDAAGNRESERVIINGELFEDLNVAARDVIYEYDELNRLIKATVNGKTTEYIYNGDGLRVGKVEDGKTTRYLYEYDKVVLEVDEAGNQTARNIYGLNLLSREVYNGTIAETMYYLYNGHADVTALVGETGEVVGTYYYDAFGNIIEATGDKDNNIMYAGYQYDEETGLYYLNARFYDPKVARFLQEDTYTGNPMDPLSLNLYSYCHNEPLMYYDPSGHKRVSPDKIEGSFSSDIANLGEEKWVVKSFCEGFVGFFTGTWEGIKNKAKYETQEFKKMCDKPLEYIPNAIRKSLTDPEKYFDIIMIIPGSAQNLKTHISRIYTLASGDKYDIAYMLGGITGEVALDMITSKIFEGVSKTFSKVTNKVKSPIKDNIDITPPNFDEVANGIDLNKKYNDTIDISDIDDLTINIPDAGGSGDNIGNMLHGGKTGNLKITEGATEANSNKIFASGKTEWTATRPKGTQQTYEIYQRNDIDWDMMRTSGDKNFIGKTNAQAAEKGLAPQLSDGNFATLHHIGQDSRGALAEVSTRYHGVGKYGQDILHSQYGRSTPNPNFPIDRSKFGVDTREYWKWRVRNE